MKTLRFRFARLLLVVALAASGAAAAQDFPARLIRFVVPSTPTSNPDVFARIIAPEMAKYLGQSVVIENKPGASQMIGFEYVARQQPADGYAFTISSDSVLVSLPLVMKDLRLDPLKELPPFIGVVESKLYLGTPARFAWKSVDEFVAHARANPGKLNYGSTSAITRIQSETLLRQYGLNVVHVPYSGVAPMTQALLAGDIHMAFVGDGPVATLGPQFRVLAVSGDQRVPSLPNVPTFAELQLPLQSVLYSLHVRAGTPKPAVDKLNAAASAALRRPEVLAQLEKMQAKVVDLSAEATAVRLANAAKVYADIARKIGLEPQ